MFGSPSDSSVKETLDCCSPILNVAFVRSGNVAVEGFKISLILVFAKNLPSTEDPHPTKIGAVSDKVSVTPWISITLALGVPCT